MVKLFLIFIAILGTWMYTTEPGKRFYLEHFVGRGESAVVKAKAAERQELSARIREKDAKIQALTREMHVELLIRTRRVSVPLRTDPIFLERSIKRLEDEKRVLEARLSQRS